MAPKSDIPGRPWSQTGHPKQERLMTHDVTLRHPDSLWSLASYLRARLEVGTRYWCASDCSHYFAEAYPFSISLTSRSGDDLRRTEVRIFALKGSSEELAINQATFEVVHRSVIGLLFGSSSPQLEIGRD